MIDLIILLLIGTILLFCFVVLFGAPYLPTLSKQSQKALELLDIKPGQKFIELGSGDGRVLLMAAKRGANCIGYEINPLLVLYSRLITYKYKNQVSVVWGNFWTKSLKNADAIYVFLLPKYMEKLNKKLTQEIKQPVKVVSFAFQIPGKKYLIHDSGLYLYQY